MSHPFMAAGEKRGKKGTCNSSVIFETVPGSRHEKEKNRTPPSVEEEEKEKKKKKIMAGANLSVAAEKKKTEKNSYNQGLAG